jgi:hypothetical protein
VADNPYARRYRSLKAHALADLLAGMGATATDAARLPAEARLTTAQVAGWSSVSDATWDAVCSVLATGRPRLV